MSESTLQDLLHDATADVPAPLLVPPIDAIHQRVRRRRNARVLAAMASVLVILVGVAVAVRPSPLRSEVLNGPVDPAEQTDTSEPARWLSTVVGRDDRHVRVYLVPQLSCQEIKKTNVVVAAQNSDEIRLAVSGRTETAKDCANSGWAVAVTIALDQPVGERQIRDAEGVSYPTFYERDLPDVVDAPGWSPVTRSVFDYLVFWTEGYNGPDGTSIHTRAWLGELFSPPTGDSGQIQVGSHQVTLWHNNDNTLWMVWWYAHDNAYQLEYEASEGTVVSKKKFVEVLSSFAWN